VIPRTLALDNILPRTSYLAVGDNTGYETGVATTKLSLFTPVAMRRVTFLEEGVLDVAQQHRNMKLRLRNFMSSKDLASYMTDLLAWSV
jgi:hypothetical protein